MIALKKFFTHLFAMLFVFFAAEIQVVCAQLQVHASFSSSYGIRITNYDMIWSSYYGDIAAYDFRTNELHETYLHGARVEGFTDSHLIFSSGSWSPWGIAGLTGELYSLSRDFKVLDTLGDFQRVAQIHNDAIRTNLFYFTAIDRNGATHLMKSDGTKGGTEIHEANVLSLKFVYSESLSGFLFIKDNQSLYFQGQKIELSPDSDPISISVLRNSREGLILQAKTKVDDNLSDVYLIDSTLNPRKLLSGIIVDEVFPAGNNDFLYIDTNPFRSSPELIYYHLPSNQTGKVKLDRRIAAEYYVAHSLGKEYYQVRSPQIGTEIAVLREDSFKVLKDFVPGPLHGAKGTYLDNGNISWLTKTNSFFNDTLYTILTNGMDARDYFYKVVNDSFICLFPVDEIEKIDYIHNGRVYQLKYRYEDKYKEYYDLVSLPLSKRQLQPTEPENTNSIWYKHFLLENEGGLRLFEMDGKVFDVRLDDQGNSFHVLSLLSPRKPLSLTPPETYDPHPLVTDNLVKINSEGRLQWVTHIGSFTEGLRTYSSVHKLVLDSKGNPIVIGYVFLDGKIGNDTIRYSGTEDRCKYFIAKIDGQTGKVLWNHQWQEFEFLSTYLDEISIDQQDNVYLSVASGRMPFIIGGKQYNSDKTTNILVKFDAEGKVAWLKPLLNNWTDTYGRTVLQGYNPHTQEIISLQSQASWHWRGPCNFRDWRFVTHQTKTTNVPSMLSSSSESDDLGWIQSGAVDTDGRVHKFGIWRGRLEINGLYPPLQSPEDKDCDKFETFYALGDPLVPVSTRVYRNGERQLKPVLTKSYGDYVYHLASFEGLAYMFKFHKNGDVIGYKKLGFWLPSETSVKSITFDADDDCIVIAGVKISHSPELGIPRYVSYPYFSVLKIENTNWDAAAKAWFEEVDYKNMFSEDLQLLVFPNPANDQIRFAHGHDPQFTTYQIINVAGEVVKKGDANERLEGIEIKELVAGIYIIQAFSNDKMYCAKWIKTN